MAKLSQSRSSTGSKRPSARKGRATAESLATQQRDISVSEFFAKNRHLLGFDNPRKALLTAVKEAVDNALDACEEAGALPDIIVRIEHLAKVSETRYRITVEDNGPGVLRSQVENIFGKLLYGSKFHRLKMSRGQQGIGISAAGMYGLMTTGKPMIIVTRSRKGKPAHHVELAMDTTKNRPEVSVDRETEEFPAHTGTRVTIELDGRYVRGRTSVDAYIEQTAIANPHAQISYFPPSASADATTDNASDQPALLNGQATHAIETPAHTTRLEGGGALFPRTVDELPDEPKEIKPHPLGVEVGSLIRMLKDTEHRQLGGFLTLEFSRLSPRIAQNICKQAGVTTSTWIKSIGHSEAEAIYKAMHMMKFQSPPLDCLAPIGARHILAGLLKGVKAEFFTAATRPPGVYRGNPFQIEVGLAFGGALPADEPAQIIRFANRVPLLYQQSACASCKSVVETSWKKYGLSQPRGAAPAGPLVVMVHMASVWVPFTSESKEAIADYDEIRKEMRLALQECGRKLGTYLRRRDRVRRERDRRLIFERYIGEVARALTTIDGALDPAKVIADLERVAKKRTVTADVELDENGKPIDRARRQSSLEKDETTVIVDAADDNDDPGAMHEAQTSPDANGQTTHCRAPRGKPRHSPSRKKRSKKGRTGKGSAKPGTGQTALF